MQFKNTKATPCLSLFLSLVISASVNTMSSGSALATVISFSDKSTFLTDTGASPTAPLPNIGRIIGSPTSADAIQTVGDLTFSIASPSLSLFIGADGFLTPWTTRTPGFHIAISDIENLNVDISSPVVALGFDFVEPQFDPNVNAPFAESTFLVSLLRSSVTVGSFSFSAPNDVAAFVGVSSEVSFDRVEIRETVGNIENEFFGQFYVAFAPTGCANDNCVVPEPASLAIFGLGLASLGFMRRRCRAA